MSESFLLYEHSINISFYFIMGSPQLVGCLIYFGNCGGGGVVLHNTVIKEPFYSVFSSGISANAE